MKKKLRLEIGFIFKNPNVCVSVLFKPDSVSWGLRHLYVIKEQFDFLFAFVLTHVSRAAF